MNIPADSDAGYIIQCDLTYPESLHQLHSDYPLAPEHLTVSRDLLNNFCNNIKTPIGNPPKNSYRTSKTKESACATIATYNFTLNMVSLLPKSTESSPSSKVHGSSHGLIIALKDVKRRKMNLNPTLPNYKQMQPLEKNYGAGQEPSQCSPDLRPKQTGEVDEPACFSPCRDHK